MGATATAAAGEALYVPAGWNHATCNLDGFTLGLGGQVASASTQPSLAGFASLLSGPHLPALRTTPLRVSLSLSLHKPSYNNGARH
eukprot:SAG11_NODE_26449_length_345_cov_0.743902_1_plen_85_part_01